LHNADAMAQLVLNALPEAVFLVDFATAEIEPQNELAARWVNSASAKSAPRFLSDLFLELDVAALIAAVDHGLLAHAAISDQSDRSDRAPSATANQGKNNSSGGDKVDVVLRVFALPQIANSKTADDEPKSLVIFARLLNSKLNAAESVGRGDALDDAFHDPLTRLPNRRLFQRRLDRAIQRASRSNYHFAVLFVDLDRFKTINDRFGHLLGDQLLVATAHRLVEAVRPQDMVARRDGDEFTILLDDLEQPDDAVGVAERILQHLELPLALTTDGGTPIDSAEIAIGASIGIVAANDAALTAEELIARADANMYQAKKLGGGTFVKLQRSVASGGVSPGGESPLPR
jgi:diguanylate cyclase (GGDEF)-like protein